MAINYTNKAPALVLASGITSASTTLNFTSNTTGFPAADFFIRIKDPVAPTTFEHCRVTAKTSTSFTVVRGQGGTTAAAWAAGAVVEHVITAEDLKSLPLTPQQFGAVGDGVTDDTAAIQATVDALPAAGGILHFPPGNYKITTAIQLRTGITILGAGYLTTRITVTGAIKGLYYEPGVLTEADITIRDIRIIGTTASALDLLSFVNCTVIDVSNCNIRDSSSDCIFLDNCHEVRLEKCRIENGMNSMLNITNVSNVGSARDCGFHSNLNATAAAVRIVSSGQWTFESNNFEGSSAGVECFILDSASGIRIINNFIELYTQSNVKAINNASRNIFIQEGNHLNGDNSVLLDFAAGALAHKNIVIQHNRIPTLVASGNIFDPGSTASFDYLENDLDGAGTHVVGYTAKNVRKLSSSVRLVGVEAADEVTISGATPSTANLSNAFSVNNAGATTMTAFTGGIAGQAAKLRFANGNTTVQSGGNFRLNGGVDITPTINDVIALLNVGGDVWVQVAPVSAN